LSPTKLLHDEFPRRPMALSVLLKRLSRNPKGQKLSLACAGLIGNCVPALCQDNGAQGPEFGEFSVRQHGESDSLSESPITPYAEPHHIWRRCKVNCGVLHAFHRSTRGRPAGSTPVRRAEPGRGLLTFNAYGYMWIYVGSYVRTKTLESLE
jgi:hypothetical protein